MNDSQIEASWLVHGETDPELMLAGHSNVVALLHGGQQSQRRVAAVYPNGPDAGGELDDSCWEVVARLGAGHTIGIVWNGNQHNAMFLLEQDPPIKVYSEGTDTAELERDGKWVPREMLHELWAPSFGQLRSALPSLVNVAAVVLFGTPPPKPSNLIQHVLAEDPFFIAQASERGLSIDDVNVTAEATRRAMWELNQSTLESIAEEYGATFVPVASSMMNDDGMLLEELAVRDATHANAAYGALMLAEMDRALDRRASAEVIP